MKLIKSLIISGVLAFSASTAQAVDYVSASLQAESLAGCEQIHGPSIFCDEVSQFGIVTHDPLVMSWVMIESGSVIRTAPTTENPVLGDTSRNTIVTATSIVYTTGSYRWVEVEVVNGIDTYIGYVREDRILTSSIIYQ